MIAHPWKFIVKIHIQVLEDKQQTYLETSLSPIIERNCKHQVIAPNMLGFLL